ncbi:MAG TPA: choice-of-anchor tandem repeat GloVer-containing protein, partial [Verrucomicrobiae bacterium]|nr:choice-of-anchor tandem repeat GloVer-containing protein [Verrucomicrobiae bacterium]
TEPSLFGHQYTNIDGTAPAGDMVLSGKLLYGTASGGGLYANGMVFSLGTNGGGFATLYAFSATVTNQDANFTNRDGAAPVGGLILSSNVLYGTTEFGGKESDGTVFSFSLLPQIGIVHSGTNVIMTWSTNLPGFTMEFTTNLAPTANWVTNPTAPVVLNGQYALTNSTSGRQKFFRLTQ